jgi:hypothetical protein
MSLSPHCHQTAKLSLGLTTQQQALARADAITAGFTEDQIGNALFTPTWNYQIQSFYEWERQWLGSSLGGNLTPTGAVNPDLVFTTIASGVVDNPVAGEGVPDMNVYYPPLILGTEQFISGPNAMNVFMADYNAAMSRSSQGLAIIQDDAMRQAHLELSVPACGGGSNTLTEYPNLWYLPPNDGTHFSFNACSIVAQELRYKVWGTNRWSDLTVSCVPDLVPGQFGVQHVAVAPDNHFIPYQPAQRVLVNLTKIVFGVSNWEFTDSEGTTQTVPAGACPILPTLAQEDELPGFTYLPDEEPVTCDFVPFTPITVIPLVPYPYDITGGGIGDPLDPITGGFEDDFVLNDGTKGPIYPEYKGALAYDLALKKWGKMKLEYLYLMDLSPINTDQGKIVLTQRFGVTAATYLPTGFIHRFDAFPEDSYIKYGKIGMHRLGYTVIEEIRVNFRLPVTGTIEIASSIDGRNPESGLVKTQAYEDATWCNMGVGASGRWHTIKISGNYDIVHLEYVGLQAGRR